MAKRGLYTQVVTSAVREIPADWHVLDRLQIVVSIDGLQPEHDVRRAPATYERILKHIAGHKIIVHCTVTKQQARRPGYLDEFIRFWSAQAEVERIWISLYTPQVGEVSEERLGGDAPAGPGGFVEAEHAAPEAAAADGGPRCTPNRRPRPTIASSQSTRLCRRTSNSDHALSIRRRPDCSSCGCLASAGLAAVARHRLLGVIPVGGLPRLAANRRSGPRLAPLEQNAHFIPAARLPAFTRHGHIAFHRI
jgi:hypothetical protein